MLPGPLREDISDFTAINASDSINGYNKDNASSFLLISFIKPLYGNRGQFIIAGRMNGPDWVSWTKA